MDRCRELTLWMMAIAVFAIFFLARGEISAFATEPITAFTKDAKVLFQGDSITDGNRGRSADPNHILGHGYAFIIAARHGAAYPEKNLDFVNRGISGNTVIDLEKRWQTDTIDLKPQMLSILIGVNDEARGVPIQEFEQTYQRILLAAKDSNPKIKLVICEPFWSPKEPLQSKQRELQTTAAKLASQHDAAFVPFQRVFDEAVKCAPAEYWIWDRVHPTYRGHQLMADEWERVVREKWHGH